MYKTKTTSHDPLIDSTTLYQMIEHNSSQILGDRIKRFMGSRGIGTFLNQGMANEQSINPQILYMGDDTILYFVEDEKSSAMLRFMSRNNYNHMSGITVDGIKNYYIDISSQSSSDAISNIIKMFECVGYNVPMIGFNHMNVSGLSKRVVIDDVLRLTDCTG